MIDVKEVTNCAVIRILTVLLGLVVSIRVVIPLVIETAPLAIILAIKAV